MLLPGMGSDLPFHWEHDDEIIFRTHGYEFKKGRTPVFETETSSDQAFWMGYVGGQAISSGVFASIALYLGAETGFWGSAAFATGRTGLFVAPALVPLVVAGTALAYSATITHASYGSEAGTYWSSMGDVGSGGAMPTVWELPTRSGWRKWWESL